jgi:glycosyltransferase involved in cell wall biosynthesis
MSAKIDRVVVINDDCTRSGGAAAIALSSVVQLRAKGLPVTMITGDNGANAELTNAGVDVVALNGRHIYHEERPAVLKGLFDRAAARRIGEWILKNDTPRTVYHLHNWHKFLSPAAFLPLRRVASRLFITAHDYFLSCPNGAFYDFARARLCDLTPMTGSCMACACDKRNYAHKLWRVARGQIRSLAMNLRSGSATVIAVHEGMVPFLARSIGPASIRILRNPSMPWLMSRVAAERNGKLLFVGRLEHDKGVLQLAEAARIARAPLRVVGSGPLGAVLTRNFPEVDYAGWRPKHEIATLCRDVRALVMPSQIPETFGLVVLEAAMSGIPTIASRSALICRDLEAAGIGIGSDAEDVTLLAKVIEQVMGDDALVEAMSRNGFERGRRLSPTPEEWATSLLALYEEKLAQAARSRMMLPETASAAQASVASATGRAL